MRICSRRPLNDISVTPDSDPPRRRVPEPDIRSKLLTGFVAVALFTGGLGVFAVNGLGRVNDSQTETYVDEFGGLCW